MRRYIHIGILVLAGLFFIWIMQKGAETTGSSVSKSDGTKAPDNPGSTTPHYSKELEALDKAEAVLYGKVVDQFDQPVAGATVACVSKSSRPDDVERRSEVKTSADGTFVYRAIHSPVVVASAHADGHYFVKESTEVFYFGELSEAFRKSMDSRITRPEPPTVEKPGVLVLQRMGSREPLLHRDSFDVLRAEQRYLIGTGDEHCLVIRYWSDPQAKRVHKNNWSVYDWGVEITVPDGGLVAVDDFLRSNPETFVAPETGYQSAHKISFDSSMPDELQLRELTRNFFVRFNDGTFARCEARISFNPKRPFGGLHSWYNPSGSRATEFDPSTAIKDDE